MHPKKQQIIMHYEQSLLWLTYLSNVSETEWRLPIQQGKWSVAEVIGHLIPWDEFVVNERLPFFFTNNALSKGPNVEQMNTEAARISRTQSKEQTVQAFLKSRRLLLHALQGLSDEQWQRSFAIGRSELTLYSYFSGLVEHDQHHFLQIQNVLNIGDMNGHQYKPND